MTSQRHHYKRVTFIRSLAAAIALMAAVFAVPAIGQEDRRLAPVDTAIYPHDFSDEFYLANGLDPKYIIGRRNGADRWSVFSLSGDRRHANVRVTATFPAYDEKGYLQFWSPLGEIALEGFTNNEPGGRLTKIGSLAPIYFFPDSDYKNVPLLERMRQAPLIDESGVRGEFDREPNPLGIHRLVMVRYTSAAFTREAAPIMDHFARKNGMATDETPIIRSTEDLTTLLSLGLVTLSEDMRAAERPALERFIISPVISDPTGGAIAGDAFLLMPLKEDKVLPAEEIFVEEFICLKESRQWCGRY